MARIDRIASMARLLTALVAIASTRAAVTKPKGLKLKYFDARGAAELSRVMLRYASVDFEDERWQIDFAAGMKTPAFEEAKAAGALAANLNRAPVLETAGGTIGQSKAIERFVARTCGLMGGDEVAAARVDAVAEHVRDVQNAQREKGFSKFSQKSDEDRAAARKEWYGIDLPSWLERLEKAVDGSGFAVEAAGRSYADFAVWALLRDTVREGDDAADVAKALVDAPHVRSIVDAVEEEAAVRAWVAERPKTRF